MTIYYSNPERDDVCQIAWEKRDSLDLWMSHDQWLHPTPICAENVNDLPEPLKVLFFRWQKEVSDRKTTFSCEWFVKCASIQFIYGNEFYVLSPEALNASEELFESVARSIEMELAVIGSPFIRYTGMLD